MIESTISPLTEVLVVIVLSFLGAIISDKLRISYPTIMIAFGFTLSVLRLAGGLTSIPLDRNIILGVVVPPLIFEAAMRTRYRVFRTVRKTVLSLAILGVILSALLSGVALSLVLGLPLAVALTFGVIISPTDPVSVMGILKRLRAPKRLTTILEAEAYFNDATAVILYPIAVSLSFAPLHDVGLFAFTFGGGVLTGLFVSGMAEALYRLIHEPMAETYFTIAVLFGSYAFAETLGVSGLVAVAIAGIYMGNRTMHLAMSRQTRETMTRFWEVVAFGVTSFAFMLLGLKTDLELLVSFAPFILAAFAVILVGRIMSVYPILGVVHFSGERIPSSWRKVLALAGLRGAVSVALALSLPESFPAFYRDAIVGMTFGVALLSLIVQGEFLQFYLRGVRLRGH